ncbi:(2Fe-2S)-binding protein [Brevibacillus centrosporus]|uniref:putative iron-sulfur cluster-binding metallochaperone n=1 Tax=Brevibacillus centrosporus TaxID=54910 RepID=UPI0011416C2E|nr:(2Fe-2S)-binding protein [Brevibacillus centrosporus]MEC2127838.1 (2Fe-2S)-binding protein [Brevibacillus centrosporus]GED32078.1 (2Fe-2S)-binding protein [Brevibacillus centrosporus]
MTSCCQITTETDSTDKSCPSCHQSGKGVKVITLKSLLKPVSLAKLHPKLSYSFCSSSHCDVVYYSELNTFRTQDLKVPVFQKDYGSEVPVCYCFGLSRSSLNSVVKANPIDFIREQIKESRCGCEVNNPQGACCLGNVSLVVQQMCKK